MSGDSDCSRDELPAGVVVFTTRFCGYCLRAKALLERKGIDYQEIPVDTDREARRRMERLAGARSVPQIFIHGRHVGGCDQLYALERAGRLDPLLDPPEAGDGGEASAATTN